MLEVHKKKYFSFAMDGRMFVTSKSLFETDRMGFMYYFAL